MIRLIACCVVLGSLAATGCSSATTQVAPVATFSIEVSTEIFRIQVSTAAQAAALRARLQSGTRGVISGDLVLGPGGFNAPWGWHLLPSSVSAPDVATEVCDGTPSLVQADLTYWMGSVGRFCPWTARVVREE